MLHVALSLIALSLVHGTATEHRKSWFLDGSSNTPAKAAHVSAPQKASRASHTATVLAQENEDGGEVAAGSVPPLIAKLQGILAELKERRDNIHHLEETKSQEEQMLQESKQMHQLASTRKGKKTFEQQLKNSEQNYQNTVSMLQDSENEARASAQALLDEMRTAQ